MFILAFIHRSRKTPGPYICHTRMLYVLVVVMNFGTNHLTFREDLWDEKDIKEYKDLYLLVIVY